MIRTLSLILARENQNKITKIQQENKSAHLARENQRELSEVFLARPRTMYYSLCYDLA
jgi:hypothetical protein